MLERTTRSYFDDICDELEYITKDELYPVRNSEPAGARTRSRACRRLRATGDGPVAVTRGARARRPRVPALQSGFCVVCNQPYICVEEHVRSRKHRKLLGEDGRCVALAAAYVAPSDVPEVEALLGLEGIAAIGLDHDFAPVARRRMMSRSRAPSVFSERPSRTRASSVVSERGLSSTPLSPASSDHAGHHLRSRKNINYSYMTPPMEDDSLQEKPDLEPVKYQYKEYRELRSSTRALAKLTSPQAQDQELWNSGRPKRSCANRQKRLSTDERLINDNRTYYKVEVLSNKTRSNDTNKDKEAEKRLRSTKQEEEKGLIVKFKKLRNTELVQLNNEATNFLFPKRDESSEEDTDVDADGANTTVSSGRNDTTLLSSDVEESKSPPHKFKVEDESSMDSTISSETGVRKRKRRTQAEAFINDNQKYYKFEMPGSSSCRLRYQGSYLPTIIKSPKSNGECTPKVEKEEKEEKPDVKPDVSLLNMDKYHFSFESVPKNASWYRTFQRQDEAKQHYYAGYNYFWDEMALAYQMPHVKPLNPKACKEACKMLKETLIHNATTTAEQEPEPSDKNIDDPMDHDHSESESISPTNEATENNLEIMDEDSKTSGISIRSCDNINSEEHSSSDVPLIKPKRNSEVLEGDCGKNPRKSPRQHASTLAILSGLIHQRKRKTKSTTEVVLSPIKEEPVVPKEKEVKVVNKKPPTTPKKKVNKVDYVAMASRIDDDIDKAIYDDMLEEYLEVEMKDEEKLFDPIRSKVSVTDILSMCHQEKKKKQQISNRKMKSSRSTSSNTRKPMKRKKNMTGWPKKTRRISKKCQKLSDGSVPVAESDSDDNSTDSNKDVKDADTALTDVNTECESEVKSEPEPYVSVAKLSTDKLPRSVLPRRTARPRRKMPGSPKSPRMLRKPRGKWYRER